jgi:hypothetical protein
MKTFLLASLIWSVIVYIVNKYQVPILREDADHIIEGVWLLFVPITGVIYGGITLLVLKITKWLRVKLK